MLLYSTPTTTTVGPIEGRVCVAHPLFPPSLFEATFNEQGELATDEPVEDVGKSYWTC